MHPDLEHLKTVGLVTWFSVILRPNFLFSGEMVQIIKKKLLRIMQLLKNLQLFRKDLVLNRILCSNSYNL